MCDRFNAFRNRVATVETVSRVEVRVALRVSAVPICSKRSIPEFVHSLIGEKQLKSAGMEPVAQKPVYQREATKQTDEHDPTDDRIVALGETPQSIYQGLYSTMEIRKKRLWIGFFLQRRLWCPNQ